MTTANKSVIIKTYLRRLHQEECLLGMKLDVENVKHGLPSRHLFQKSNNVAVDNFIKTISSFSYHIEWKIFIKASRTNNIHTRENVFTAATFEGLWVVSFQTD